MHTDLGDGAQKHDVADLYGLFKSYCPFVFIFTYNSVLGQVQVAGAWWGVTLGELGPCQPVAKGSPT